MSNEIHCPKCNSTQITAQKHGFSAGKAVAGAVLTGGIGLLAGLHGSSNIDVTCLSCGHKWNPKKLADQKRQEEQAKQIADLKAWKRKWYKAYEGNHYEDAASIFLLKEKFRSNTPDIHSAYKFYKKNDLQFNIIMCVFMIILILIICWIVS